MALDTTIGGPTADSYGTTADWEAYGDALGWNLGGDGHATHDEFMRRAAMYLDRNFSWIGTKVDGVQAMQWPRSVGTLVDGFPVDSASIPTAIIQAQFELAWLSHEGVDLFATVESGAVKRIKEKVDVIETETEYVNPREHALFTSVQGLVAPYSNGLRSGGGFGSIAMVRA